MPDAIMKNAIASMEREAIRREDILSTATLRPFLAVRSDWFVLRGF
jgi:hypothetical protein